MKRSLSYTLIVTMILIVSVLVTASSENASADSDTNVALNKSVTLNGTFFTGGWGTGMTVDPSTVVDGTFLPQSTQWDQGPVWWDSTSISGQYLTIDLAGVYCIESLIAQVDDNDAYKLFYWDLESSSWQLAWDIPNYDVVNSVDLWGMQTRPDPYDDTERYILPSPIITNQLKLVGNDSDSFDLLFSVSEIQAFGYKLLSKSFCGAEIQMGEWNKGKWNGGEWISVSEWHILNGGTGDEQWYPKNQRTRWPVTFRVPNKTDEDWTSVVLTDHFGAELELLNMEYELDGMTYDVEEIGVGNLNKDPKVDENGIGFYTNKGKSEQLRFIWEIGELPAGDDHTLTFYIATDLNPGQSKKDMPKWEFTSCGIHALNSGANLEWVDGSSIKKSINTEAWAIQVCKPTPPVTTEIQAPMINGVAYILIENTVQDEATVHSLEGVRGVNCEWYPAATGDVTFQFSVDGSAWSSWGSAFNWTGSTVTSEPVDFDEVGRYYLRAVFESADNNYNDSKSGDLEEPLEVIQLSMVVEKTGDELSKILDFVDYLVTVTNTSSGNVPPMTFYLGDPVAHINKSVVIPLGVTDVTSIPDVEIPVSAADPYVNTVMVHATVQGLPYEIDGSDTWETNLFQPNFEVTFDADEQVAPGEEITWTVTVANNSSADAPNVNISFENLFTGASAAITGLPSGDTGLAEFYYTTDQGDIPQIDATLTVEITYDDFPNEFNYEETLTTMVNSPPVADFGIDDDLGNSVEDGGSVGHCDQPLVFWEYCTDPDGDALTYEWDFDNGDLVSSNNIVYHSFMYVGEHTITLTVTDPYGASDSITKTIYITNATPDAHFVITNWVDPMLGGIKHCDQPVRFYNDSSDSDECDESNLYSEWDFGDGSPIYDHWGTMIMVEHEYTAVGYYHVTLTVMDNHGGSASYDDWVMIGNQNPDAHFLVNIDGNTVDFYNGSSDNDECDNLTYEWNFGDGTSSYAQNPSPHTYVSAGEYTVELWVWDDWGGQGYYYETITISEPG